MSGTTLASPRPLSRLIPLASRSTARALFSLFLALSLAVALAVAGVGSAAGGDQAAILSTEQDEIDVAPGEEFTVEVALYSEGGHGDDAVEAVTIAAQYHPDFLEITDVERGPWLEQGEETDVRAERTLAHDRGTAVLEQERDPVAGGATGMDTVATLTVEVAEDAPAGETRIQFDESDVDLESDWPVPVVSESVTVAIDGGEDELESFDHPSVADLSSEEGASPETNEEDDTGDAGDEPFRSVTGIAVGVLLLAAVTGIALLAARTWQTR